MSKRIIKIGTWNNQPLEWIVLKVESYGSLVICKDRIGKYAFDSSNNNSWGSSSLRKFLNKDFFDSVFSNEEKKKIVNSRIDRVKDNVFVLTESEVSELVLKDGSDPYEDSYYNNCSYCYWTRTTYGSNVRTGYAKGCWCNYGPNNSKSVRPAMYIKENLED